MRSQRYLLWSLLLPLGCGDPSPVEQCDALVDVVCDRLVDCLGGGTEDECVQAVQTALPCGSARAVSASYDRCLDQLETNSCSILFPTNPQTGQRELLLPADCRQVILTRDAEPPATAPSNATDRAAVR